MPNMLVRNSPSRQFFQSELDDSMKRAGQWRAGLWALLTAILSALAVPMVLGGQALDVRVVRVQVEIPPNLSLIQQALQRRGNLHLPPGQLQASNTAVIQKLTTLIERTKALQELIAAGPTPGEFALIDREWRDIKSEMVENGVTPQEQAGGTAGQQPTAPASGLPASPNQPGVSGSSPSSPTPTPTPAGTAGTSQTTFASPVADLSSMSFTYELGVSPKFNLNGSRFQGGCTFGSGAITSDAAVWDVVVTLVPREMTEQGFHTIADFFQTNDKGVVLMPLIRMHEDTQLLVTGRKAYIGRAVQNLIAPKFHFRQLSLNEVTDLLQALKGNDAKIKAAFGAAMPQITVVQIRLQEKANAAATLLSVENTLLGSPDLITPENLMNQLIAHGGSDLDITLRHGAAAKVHIERPITVTYSAPELTGDTADELTRFASALANLGMKTDSINLAKPAGDRLKKEDGTPSIELTGKALVIENECLQLSFTPGVQDGGISPSANFRGRISYLPENLPLTLKLSAEGESSSDPNKPRRVAGAGDFTYVSKPFWGGWYATAGATGDSSYSQLGGIGITEWRGGGKFELQTPVQKFFPVRSGNDQKPTLTVETGGIGGNAPNTKTTFVVRGDFVYTLQPSAKIFLDFRAAAGHSPDARFNHRNDFSYGFFAGRFAIYNDWDFIARYECGRKDPLYLKSCGWQTGFGFKTK